MKKLGKLIINPEKVIKNEELVNLRGGDYGGQYWVSCKDNSGLTCGGFTQYSCNDHWAIDMACWVTCYGDYSGYICVE